MNSKVMILILLVFSGLYSIESEYLEYDEAVSLIDHYRQYPLNINTATVSDIYELPYLDEVTAELIFRRIDEKGEVNTLEILVAEEILSSEYSEILKNCVKFSGGKKEIRTGFYSLRFTRRFEESEAYQDSVYLGNRSRFNQKFGIYSEKVSMNLIVEKEPGEINYTDNMKGNIVLSDTEYRLILGNFNSNSSSGMLQKEGFVFDQYSFTSSKDFHDFTRPSPSSNDYSGYTGASVYYTFDDTRVTAYRGIKYLSATLNDDEAISSVSLYAYTRTLTEIERYHNARHEVTGAGVEREDLGFRYAASITNEKFDREIDPDADLSEGTTGEFSLRKTAGDWNFRADTATDLDKFNLKLNAQHRTKDMTMGFFYGYVQKDKFCLSSPGMFFGSGEEEHVYGMKFKIRINPKLIFISENLIFSTIDENTAYPGAKLSIKTDFRLGNLTFEPNFVYKYKENSDDDFVLSQSEEYQTKLKAKFETGKVASSTFISYTDCGEGVNGYLLGSNITAGTRKFRIRIGGDIYQTKNGASVYSALADTGKYASLTSFSGVGSRSYIMFLYSTQLFEISAGFSRQSREDGDTSGSGYDLINSDTVHDAELNFKVNF